MKFVYPKKGVDLDERDYAATYGHFPLSSFNTWHGGLHLDTARAPLVAICDGRVIAYRLTGQYRATNHAEPQWYSDGFVLLQHYYSSPEGQELTFYSLYHHLASKAEIDRGAYGLSAPKFLSTPALKITANEYPAGVRGRSPVGPVGGRGAEVALVPKNYHLSRNPDSQLAPWARAYNAGRTEGRRYHSYRYVDVFSGAIYPELYIHDGTVTRSGRQYRVTYTGDGVTKSGRRTTEPLYPQLERGALLYDLPDDGRGEPAIGTCIGTIPRGTVVEPGVGALMEAEGWGFSTEHNGYFSLKGTEEAFHFREDVETDTVVACNIPVDAEEVIGYVGRFGFERQEEAYGSHVEIFTAASDGELQSFLRNTKGDGAETHYRYTLSAGTRLQPHVRSERELAAGTRVRLSALADSYAQVEVQTTRGEVTNEIDILVDKVNGVYVRARVAGKERIQYRVAPGRFDAVNAAFLGRMLPDDKVYLDRMVSGTNRRVVVLDRPDAGEKVWIDSSVLGAPPPRLGSAFDLPGTACCRYLGRPYPVPPSGDTYQRDVLIDRLPEERVTDDEGTGWRLFSSRYSHDGIGYHHVGWLREDSPDLIKMNPFDWTAFGFCQHEGGSEYVYGVEDYLHFEQTHAFVNAVWALADGNGDRVLTPAELLVAQRTPATAERMGKMIVKHKNEWSYTPGTIRSEARQYFDVGIELEEDTAKKQGLVARRDELLDHLTDKLTHLMWWEEARAAPYTPPPEEPDEEQQAQIAEYGEKREEITTYYADPWFQMTIGDPNGERRAADLDQLDRQYHQGRYVDDAPVKPTDRQFPASAEVWHFQPHSFVRQMRLIHREEGAEIIFPLLVRPANDSENRFGAGYNWAATTGRNMARFGAGRGGGRLHAGRDLYTDPFTEVVAIAPGKVLAVRHFYDQTHQITIHHTTRTGREFIIRYGEVDPNNINVRVGDHVEQGDIIGKTGRLINRHGRPTVSINGEALFMIHFEHYDGSAGMNLNSRLSDSSNPPYKRRSDLVDPLAILQEGYDNTFNGTRPTEDVAERVSPTTLEPSPEVIDFVKDYESFRSRPYNDSEGYCTIGYGHLIARNGCANITVPSEFRSGITRERADELFDQRLLEFVRSIQKDITAPLLQQEFDALFSLVFNTGTNFLNKGGRNKGPTMIKTHINAGRYAEGAEEFRDVTNGGEEGLIKRRRDEINMFKNGAYQRTH